MNLAKVIFMLKHSMKLRSYLLCGYVAACHGIAFVLNAVQNALCTACNTHAFGGSIPDGVLPALGSTQPLTEMSTWNIP
jgi:hypothetical protein